MLLTRAYYQLKPWLPRKLVVAVRRRRAQQLRRQFAGQWPIFEPAGRTPDGWPGWPDAKRFAFVLTHDVESAEGVARVRQLAELEMGLGFRSSFNFIPEGGYTVPDELRAWLVGNGFEVGVHDLHHDGKLYRSRHAFAEKARRINRYLRKWNAVGFRSGFMLHNLDWARDLEAEYEASTFDFDPFEPQPDGAETIFPFLVPGRGGRPGYVELPYTLVQDFTLFVLLQEKTCDIWKKKLDWVAARGGMALLNLHPDFVGFGTGSGNNWHEFPVGLYRDFLEYAKDRYSSDWWHPLPRDVACHVRGKASAVPLPPKVQSWLAESAYERKTAWTDLGGTTTRQLSDGGPESKPLAGKRVAVLLYSFFPSDARPRRAALAMAEAGAEVDFVCLRSSPNECKKEDLGGLGIRIRRLPIGRDRGGGKFSYLLRYGVFLMGCCGVLAWRCLRQRYDLVHVHNMPDVLVFAALPAKLRGARVILDLHDPMPELMMSIYDLESANCIVRTLRLFERWSIAFADLALTPNITFKNIFVSRSAPGEKVQIVMNSPQEEIFDPDRLPPPVRPVRGDGEFRVMHHGLIAHRHGVDQLVEALAEVRKAIPGVHLDLYGGSTPFLETVLQVARRVGVDDIMHYHGGKPQREIALAIRECHLGVVPNRRSPFTETNFPTRLFEYLAMHRPVIAPSTQGIRDYFDRDAMLFFEPGNVADLARQIIWVYENPAGVDDYVRRGIEVYRRHLWCDEKRRLVSLAAGLVQARR